MEKGTVKKGKKKCFVIMPISDHSNYPDGHFTRIYEQIIKPAIEDADYDPIRVDENKISAGILGKIIDNVSESEMAICDLSSRNPNVLYELGLRHAYGKPVVLICDEKTERIFDVAGINTVQYKSTRLYEEVIEARKNISEAIKATEKSPTALNIIKKQEAKVDDSNHIDDNAYIKYMLNSMMEKMSNIQNMDVSATLEREEQEREQRKRLYNIIKQNIVLIKNAIKRQDVSTKQLMIYQKQLISYKMRLSELPITSSNDVNLILIESEINSLLELIEEELKSRDKL